MTFEIRRTSVIILVLLLAAGLRVGFLATTPDRAFLQIDGEDYRDIAAHLAQGDGFAVSQYRWFEARPLDQPPVHPDLYRPPLLPLLGAVLFHLPGAWMMWARTMSLLIGLGCVLVIYFLAKELFGTRSARIAALLWAVYPFAIFYSARWSTENLFLISSLGGLLFLSRARRDDRFWTPFFSGLCFGLAGLARPQGLALFAVMAGWFALKGKRRLGISVLALLIGGLVILTPWSIRNYRQTGTPTPATLFGPYNLWLGMNDRVYEMYRAGESDRFADELEALYQVDSKQMARALDAKGITDPRDAGQYWIDETIKYLKDHPDRALSILGYRAMHFFRPWPNRAVTSIRIFWMALLSAGPAIVVGLSAIVLRREARSSLLLLPVATNFLVSLPFVFHLRFRFPIFDPLMIIAAACLASGLLGIKRSGSTDSASAYATHLEAHE